MVRRSSDVLVEVPLVVERERQSSLNSAETADYIIIIDPLRMDQVREKLYTVGTS